MKEPLMNALNASRYFERLLHVFLLCCMFLVIYGCKKQEEVRKLSISQGKISAATYTVRAKNVPVYTGFSGNIEPKTVVRLSAKAPGYVSEVRFKEGEYVKRGEVLVRLDDTSLRENIASLRAEKLSVLREKEAVYAQFIYAKKNFQRFRRLFKDSAATKEELDRARAGFQSLKRRVEAFSARISSIEHKISSLKSELKYQVIKSPVSGWITKKMVDKGTFVGPGALLFELYADGDGAWFVAYLNEALFDKVNEGDDALLFMPSIKADGPLACKIERKVPQIDPLSHTFKVKVDLEGVEAVEGKTIKAKMGAYGRLWVKTGVKDEILLLDELIISRGGIKGVYVVGKDNVIAWRVIQVGRAYLDTGSGLFPVSHGAGFKGAKKVYSITGGLFEGERVVASNLDRAREGMRIE